MTRAAAMILGVLAALPALAQPVSIPDAAGILRPGDTFRIERIERAKDEAAASVRDQVSESDYAALLDRLAEAPAAGQADPARLIGDWSCATTKIGPLGLVTYDAFRCRIARQPDGGLMFDKLSGSQRVRGQVLRRDGALVLAGVGYIAGDTPVDYADLPDAVDPSALPQRVPAPGVIEVLGTNHARILFPYPQLESTLDILELTR